LSVLTCAAAGVAVWGACEFVRTEFPDVSVLKTRYPVVHYEPCVETPAQCAQALKRGRHPESGATVTISRLRPSSWVSLGEVSKVAVGAILVSEDWAFYQHKGYDANQIKEAIREDWEEGRFARGASTITQQVARNVFLDKDKNLWRKVKELILAVRLEQALGKRRILEVYLNIAEWGEGIFGIRAASRHYFGKDPSELTAREGAFLAMLLPSPKRYSQSFRAHKLTDYARETMDAILGKMAQAHYLTDDERDGQVAATLSFEEGAAPVATPPATGGEPVPAPDQLPSQQAF
jgi:monofunctional biosynthetic peptidoglycan transglycosylase